jgi:spermidine/putrescine transport system substrate-binding protein
MDINDTIKRIKNRDISRRDFSKALAAVGLTTVMMPVTSKPSQAADGEAIYFTWSGYDIPEIWPGYVEKHGVVPDTPIFGDAEESFVKVRAGFEVDVMHPCSNNVPRWKSAGILQPIDTSRLSNWNDVIPALQTVEGTQFGGEQWFVPFEWGQTSVTYRTDLYEFEDGEEESWGMLWNEKYAGRLSIIDAAEDSWWCAAIYAGIDTQNLKDEDFVKVLDLLKKQQDLLLFRQSDMTTVTQALTSGEVVAAMTWNSVPLSLANEGIPSKFANVKEGALTWVCGVVMTADAPHYDKAHDLIDAMLGTDAGEFLVVDYGYGHANTKTYDTIGEDVLAARGLTKDPMEILSAGTFLEAQTEEIEQKINRDWGELISSM